VSESAEEFITQHGSIFKTPSGYVQQVPQVSIAQQNLKIMQSFCTEFGLTPATRARIIAAGGGSDDTLSNDPLEKLLKGGRNNGV
jgi:P27 family predicted phage terminase small subunit